jgi:hypothetical protein
MVRASHFPYIVGEMNLALKNGGLVIKAIFAHLMNLSFPVILNIYTSVIDMI